LRLQPLLELPDPNIMLNSRLSDHDRDRRLTRANIIHPIVLAERAQSLRYRFIERIGRHLNRMFDPLEVAARHRASAKAHSKSG